MNAQNAPPLAGMPDTRPRAYEAAHRALARRAAAESIVLLQNEGTVPPLAVGSRLALYGAGALQMVKGGTGSIEKRHGIHIVYTKEAETADMYIEQASYDLSRKHRVRVATSDGMEQMIILGHGAERMSATELKWEVEQADEHLRGIIQNLQP